RPGAKPQLIDRARAQVLEHDVRVADQRREPLDGLAVLEVHDDRALVGVDGEKAGRRALPERRAPLARVVALGALDLDDVGTEVREDLAGHRPGQRLSDLDDTDAVQHRRAHRNSARAMTMRCTSEGPSPMRRTRASRYQRSSGNSLDTP